MLKQQNELQNHFHSLNYSNYNILNFYYNKHRHRRLNFSIRNLFFIKNINTFKLKSIFLLSMLFDLTLSNFSTSEKNFEFFRESNATFLSSINNKNFFVNKKTRNC